MKGTRLVAALLLFPALVGGEPVNPKVVERYKQMLATNPVEGIALDRLWNSALEGGRTEELMAEYRKADTFASQMVLGHLLRKAGKDAEAAQAFARASALDNQSPLPSLASAKLENDRVHPREAAAWLEKAAAALPPGDPRLPEALLQLGAAWLAAGEAAKAAAAWEHTAVVDPNNLDLRRRLATAYTDNFLPEQAITHLEYIVDHGPVSERVAALQQIAKLQSAAGHAGEAIKALERAVAQTAPGNWMRTELLAQIIRIAQRQRVEGDLEAKWKKQVEQAPRDLGGYLQLVEFYERTGDQEKQREWLEKVLGLAPKSAETRLKLARLLVQLDQLDRAAALYDELLAAQPGDADLVFERSRLDLQREDSEPARTRLAALLARKPGDEALRSRVLEFYQEHHLHDLVEQHLKIDAANGGEEEAFALANFYFSQQRVPAGLETLRRLVHPEAPPEQRAALSFRTAQMLKAQGELGAAVDGVNAAIAVRPQTREYYMLLGDLQNTRTQYAAARSAFTTAYTLSATDADRLEADGKLFQSIREEHAAPPDPADGGRSRSSKKQEPAQAAVGEHIRGLMTEANEKKTAAAWLRVAQWMAWNGDKASAVTFANKGSELEPNNPAPHEFLVRHAIANGDPAFALVHLRELLDLNPTHPLEYEREIARLELQRGNTREALAAYEQLARANPGNAAALTDLATAQDRARKLDDAAATWRQVLAALPAPRKREAASALLRVLQELGNHEEACAMLLRSVEETPDEKDRLIRFDELLLYCQQHGRLDWLRAKFEDRRKLRADDYFTAIALGRVLKVLGEKSAAFELFADAALSAPKQAEALPELIREAEELQRLDTAVQLQEQFTRLVPQEGPDGFIKLAALCEKTGDLEGAERAWGRAVAKFPRDVEVLRRGAEFHQQWGDSTRAATLWRKLLTLDPANARVAATLGALDYEAGNLDEARTAFEAVMRLTKPVTQQIYPSDPPATRSGESAAVGAPRRFSSTGSFSNFPQTHSLMGYAAGKPSPESEMRLGSLRRLAEIARQRGGSDLQRWRADWEHSPDGTEPLWALYFSGARAQVLDRIEARIKSDAQNSMHRQAWIWIALESGEHARLSAWLNAPTATSAEWSAFSDAFGEFLRDRPEAVTPAMIAALFPPGTRARISQSAVALSSIRRFPEAITLARRVFEEAGTQRPNVGRELARMYLAAGKPAEAMQILDRSSEAEGDWFESPVYEAMRDYCLLAGADERAKFIRRKLETTDARTVHGLITRVLLHSLSGEEDQAATALDALSASRAMTGPVGRDLETAAREWLFLSNAANTLGNWGLPALANRLWDHAFADEGLLASQGHRGRKPLRELDEDAVTTAGLIDDARLSREALRYLTGGPVERAAVLEGVRRRPRGLERLGELLEAGDAPNAAVEVSLFAWESAPNDPPALRRAMDACQAAKDEVTAEKIRRRVLSEKLNPGSDGTPTQFAEEFSQQLEQRGDVAGALQIIATAKAAAPGDLTLAHRHASLLQLSGAAEAAEAELRTLARSDGGNAYAREQLAQMLQRQGKLAEALALRRRSGGGGDPQLPLLQYQAGQADEARISLEKLSGSYAVFAAMTLAEAMGLAGDAKGARSVLVATADRVSDPRSQLQLRSKLLRIPGAPPTAQFVTRTEAKMRALVEAQPELEEAYYEFFDRHATKLGLATAWTTESAHAWADGAGPLPAGLSVLRQCLAAGDLAGSAAICEKIAGRMDVTDAFLEKASAALAAARQDELRLRLAEIGARRGWPRAQPTLAWVQLLRELGRGEQARTVLQQHSWLALFDGGALALGRAWLELGDAEMAREYTQRALARSALSPSPAVLAQMARVQVASKQFAAARLLLRRAFEIPSCREYEALAEYFDLAGELPHWREAAGAFALHPSALYGLKLALFSRFERQGRLAEAVELVGTEPTLVTTGTDDPRPGAITCARLRALAVRTGGFAEITKIFASLAESKAPGIEAEILALEASRVETAGEAPPALTNLEHAARFNPNQWEFARRLAELQIKSGHHAQARTTLSRYLATPGKPIDREAAFELWDRVP